MPIPRTADEAARLAMEQVGYVVVGERPDEFGEPHIRDVGYQYTSFASFSLSNGLVLEVIANTNRADWKRQFRAFFGKSDSLNQQKRNDRFYRCKLMDTKAKAR